MVVYKIRLSTIYFKFSLFCWLLQVQLGKEVVSGRLAYSLISDHQMAFTHTCLLLLCRCFVLEYFENIWSLVCILRPNRKNLGLSSFLWKYQMLSFFKLMRTTFLSLYLSSLSNMIIREVVASNGLIWNYQKVFSLRNFNNYSMYLLYLELL